MVQKIPPPTFFTGAPGQEPDWQGFNRWLLEVTSILSNEGGINPDQVEGLPAVITQVGTNTTNIAALSLGQGGQGLAIVALQNHDVVLDNEIIAINGALTTLGARAQVLSGSADPAPGLGNINDWYANTAGAVGHRIFVKTAIGTWFAFPF